MTMRTNFFRLATCLLTTSLLSTLLISASSFGQDWPSLRGSDGLGSANPSSNLADGGKFKLETRWKKKIGSGYSSVVVANGRVVTMYTDGTNDLLASLSASTGETVWTLPVGPKFKGENGSFDGPLSTPAIDDGKIYAISATGKILCVGAESGDEIWTKELVEDFGATKPTYGFVTSPVIVENTLVIQTGIQDKSLMGLDPATGESRWAVSSDRISSQTPFATEFKGKTIVLACGGVNLMGVNPADGEIYFEAKHGGGNGSAMTPVPIGDDTYLLTLDDSYSKAFQLSENPEGGIDCTEKWKANSIKNTYNIPVASGENIFAYSTRILTSVDPATGRAHWKSRKPGDGFLIAIDNHLIINTKKGQLYVAKASQEGFQPIANLELFDDLVWSVPAYSDNSIFARSLGEIARVDIVPANQNTTAVADNAMPLGPAFSKFLDRIEKIELAEKRSEAVKAWLAEQESLPVIENDIVHFVYQGDEKDIALASDMFGARQEKPMVQVADTNLYYYSMKLPLDQRANYVFFVNFKAKLDPRNSRVMTSSMYAGEMEFAMRLRGAPPLKMSWFAMSDWKKPAYLNDGIETNIVSLK